MSRKLCVTAVDGQTGHLITELLLTHPDFSKRFSSIAGLALNPQHELAKQLESLGALIIPHIPGRKREMTNTLKKMDVDAICIIPPTHVDKYDITMELIDASKAANIPNVCFISAAGADLADPVKQPRLREFIDLEHEVLVTKGDTSTETGHSPVIIRAGFYAENILRYAEQMRSENCIPLPIGTSHKFAPIALGDVAEVAAHVLSGKGKHGFADKHRGQLIVLTGGMLVAGNELATAASSALGVEMKFEDISKSEARKLLKAQPDLDPSELEFLLEYYTLVREGKTNYTSTLAFHAITGRYPMLPPDFFKTYADECANGRASPSGHQSKRRKTKQ